MTPSDQQVLTFVLHLRQFGLDASPARVRHWMQKIAARRHDSLDAAAVIADGATVLCTRREDHDVYVRALSSWMGVRATMTDEAIPESPSADTPAGATPAAVAELTDETPVSDRVSIVPGSTSPLRYRDHRDLTPEERDRVRAMLAEFPGLARSRPGRRRHAAPKGEIDLAATAQHMFRSDGEVHELSRRRRVARPKRGLLLIDISQSMSAYSESLLRLAYALVRALPVGIEVFTFATHTTRITERLAHRDVDIALARAGSSITDWGGGTALGTSLKQLLDRWGASSTVRSTTCVIASDGWCVDPALAKSQITKLARLTDRLIWADPQARRSRFRAVRRSDSGPSLTVRCVPTVSQRRFARSPRLDDVRGEIGGSVMVGDTASLAQTSDVDAAVRRVINRDDLLQLAYEAEAALGIARSGAKRDFRDVDQLGMFQRAFDIHIENALSPTIRLYSRSQFFAYAGKLVEFCERAQFPIQSREWTAVDLFHEALEATTPATRRKALRREPTQAVIVAHLAARSLRLAGRVAEAMSLVAKPEGHFYATGVEYYRALYEYELVASLLTVGQERQVHHALGESETYWSAGRAVMFDDRHRHHYALAITDWRLGDLAAAEERMAAALVPLDPQPEDPIDDWRDVCRLSVTLGMAELLHARHQQDPWQRFATRSLSLLKEAVRIAQQLRARWRVVVRSRSPLALVIRRAWGDMALLAVRLGLPDADAVGAEIALSAKQSGLASLMRAERSQLRENTRVVGIIDEIQEREALFIDNAIGLIDRRDVIAGQLQRSRFELLEAVTPVLAELVLPRDIDLSAVSRNLGTRHGIDFAALPDSLDAEPADPHWFRTSFTPNEPVTFELVSKTPALGRYFESFGDWSRLGMDRWLDPAVSDQPSLADTLLPSTLLARLRSDSSSDGIAEIVISGHGRLSHFPWPALPLGQDLPLVDRAVVTQCLVLSALGHKPFPKCPARP